jgi:hypothetical protein
MIEAVCLEIKLLRSAEYSVEGAAHLRRCAVSYHEGAPISCLVPYLGVHCSGQYWLSSIISYIHGFSSSKDSIKGCIIALEKSETKLPTFPCAISRPPLQQIRPMTRLEHLDCHGENEESIALSPQRVHPSQRSRVCSDSCYSQ